MFFTTLILLVFKASCIPVLPHPHPATAPPPVTGNSESSTCKSEDLQTLVAPYAWPVSYCSWPQPRQRARIPMSLLSQPAALRTGTAVGPQVVLVEALVNVQPRI